MFTDVRVLIIGDTFLVRQLQGEVQGISEDAPVPVLSLTNQAIFPGGAGLVAAAVAALGAQVTLGCVIGDDPEGAELLAALRAQGVNSVQSPPGAGLLTRCESRVVTSLHQQILRLDRQGDRSMYLARSSELLKSVLPEIEQHHAVILCDLDKGTLAPEVAQGLVLRCRELKIPCVVASSKAKLSSFTGANLLVKNLALGQAAFDEEAVTLRKNFEFDAVVLSQGQALLTLATEKGTQQFQASMRRVADLTGVGGTVAAVLGTCLGSGWEMEKSFKLAGVAAGIAASLPGNHLVHSSELNAAWPGFSPKVLDREAACERVQDARGRGLEIVFTNGCFDLLHAGHLLSLEQARQQGDFLVVGLNSDQSVKVLKGPTRPVISQDDRARLLAGLSCVDLVVIFDDETPDTLINAVQPDVLVKGGDYTVDQIVGAQGVLDRGGRVVIIPLLPGRSTTMIISETQGKPKD